MKKEPKSKIFERLFNYWSVKLLDSTYPIIKDNRCNCHMLVDEADKKIVIRYNTRKLGKWQEYMILNGIFHEIGHIKQRFCKYNTEKQQIECERDAEVFSIQMIKTYYPEYLEPIIERTKKQLKSSKWKKENHIHWEAFNIIREYKI